VNSAQDFENDLDSEEEWEVLKLRRAFCTKESFFNASTKGFPFCPACFKHKMSGREYSYHEILCHSMDVRQRGQRGQGPRRELHRLLARGEAAEAGRHPPLHPPNSACRAPSAFRPTARAPPSTVAPQPVVPQPLPPAVAGRE